MKQQTRILILLCSSLILATGAVTMMRHMIQPTQNDTTVTEFVGSFSEAIVTQPNAPTEPIVSIDLDVWAYTTSEVSLYKSPDSAHAVATLPANYPAHCIKEYNGWILIDNGHRLAGCRLTIL